VDGINTEIDKLDFISKFPTPKKVKDIQRFLGISGWYNKFVKNYLDTVTPLTNMLAKGNLEMDKTGGRGFLLTQKSSNHSIEAIHTRLHETICLTNRRK